MTEFEVFGPYLVALLMGMGTLCSLIWAVLAGALTDSDQASLNHFLAEMDNDRFADHHGQRHR